MSKKTSLPDETIDKLINNEFKLEMNIDETEGSTIVVNENPEAIDSDGNIDDGEDHGDGNTEKHVVSKELEESIVNSGGEVIRINEKSEESEESEESEVIDYNDVDYSGRGFESLDDAILFMDTPYFKGLGEAEKNEYRNWLIKK